jgi:hypothetical protein
VRGPFRLACLADAEDNRLSRLFPLHYVVFSAHFASAASCSFFGSFRCSSQKKRNRGPFERFC